jgi:hypothetical protein
MLDFLRKIYIMINGGLKIGRNKKQFYAKI